MRTSGFVCSLLLVFGSITSVTATIPDSLDSHSDAATDTVSVRHFASMGTLTHSSAAQSTYSKNGFLAQNHASTSRLVSMLTPWYYMSAGDLGQFNGSIIAGNLATEQSFSLNGRHLIDPWSGVFNMDQISPESIEKIELDIGTRAVLYGARSAGVSLNFQQAHFNHATPYFRLWYGQGAGNMIGADVLASQNIAHNVNATIGIRRTGARGVYARTDFGYWNARTNLRWSPSMNNTWTFNYDYSSLAAELWGGLAPVDQSQWTRSAFVSPRFQNLADSVNRHDISIGWFHTYGVDTASRAQVTIWSTPVVMERVCDSTFSNIGSRDTTPGYRSQSIAWGMVARNDFQLNSMISLRSGTSFLSASRSATPYNDKESLNQADVWQGVNIAFSSTTTVEFGLRQILSNYGNYLNFGAAFTTSLLSNVATTFDMSFYNRSQGYFAATHSGNLLGVFRNKIYSDNSTFELIMFYNRATLYPRYTLASSETIALTSVEYLQLSSVSQVGVVVQSSFHFGPVSVRPTITSTYLNDEVRTSFYIPQFAGSLQMDYTYSTHSSSVSLGVNGYLQTHSNPMMFIPQTWNYAAADWNQGAITNGMNLFLNARFSAASLHIAFENIFAQPYALTHRTPQLQQNLRVTLSWAFFD